MSVHSFFRLCVGFWVCCLLGTQTAQAALLTKDTARLDLTPELALLEDPGKQWTLQDLTRPEVAERFVPWNAEHGDVNMGFSTSAWWVRVRLQRTADAPRTWILDIPDAYNKYLDFYAPGLPPVLTGHGRPLQSRPIFSRHFAFPVALSDTAQDHYLRVESNYAISLPMVLWQASAYAEHTIKMLLAEFLYYGALLMLVIYNAFLWWSLRDVRFGYYALFGLFLNGAMFSANGLGAVFLWPDWHDFDDVSSGMFFSAAGVCFMAFVRSFLRTRQARPTMDRVLQGTGLVYLTFSLLFVVQMRNPAWISGLFQAMLLLAVLTIVLVYTAMARQDIWLQPGIRYFALAWSSLALGVMVTVLRTYDWLPTNGLTAYATQIGSALEMVLFAFALAAVVRDERQQRIQAQADMLTAKEAVIGLLQEGEQRLASAVEARTQELHQALRREHDTLVQYLRFAALVSHEFRNRLNVISSQADMLFKQLDTSVVQARTQVIKRSVNHLAHLTDKWLDGDRLLHSDVRASTSALAVWPWLQTLLDKSPQYRETHRLVLDGLPADARLQADPELLEIAVGNLIDNACKYTPPGSAVRISLVHQPGLRGIAVQDQGSGIAQADRENLFEPYVRLAPEGPVSGSGLGLNFVRRIAEAHGGKVTLQCPPAQGCTFVIWLPDTNDE